MFSAMFRLAGLLGTAALWVGVLWFVIRLDFSHKNLLSVISIHLLPPLLAWGGWAFWRRQRGLAKTNAESAAKARAEADQIAQRESALQAYQEKLRIQRYALDCRWASVVSDGLADSLSDETQISIARFEAHDRIDNLSAVVVDTLSKLFAECAGAQYLPVYVAESPAFDLTQTVVVLKSLRGASANAPKVSALPRDDEIIATIFDHFEREPDLPGAIFIAVNGAFGSEHEDQMDDFSLAKPKLVNALVVMLFTNPALASASAKLASESGDGTADYDPMTPFWERKQAAHTGLVERLSQMPAGAPTALLELPVMAQLRRPTEVAGPKPDRAWSGALEQCLINANLKQKTFVWDNATPPEATHSGEESEEINCAWVVHNAGSFEHAGDRLASLGKALDAHSIDLNIIREGTNVLAEVKLGALDQWVSVALAILLSQKFEAPTVWAMFGARSAMGLITPALASDLTTGEVVNI
jgi:hypothetical protein